MSTLWASRIDRSRLKQPVSNQDAVARAEGGGLIELVTRLLMLPVIAVVSVCWLAAAAVATVWLAVSRPLRHRGGNDLD